MASSQDYSDIDALLEYVKQSRGFDFTGYKRSSITRRIHKRMQTVGIEEYSDYLDYLEVHPNEFQHLFNTLLINVTGFFRDRPVWEYVCSEVIPRILSRKDSNEPIRIWSAGCASGEEVYTLAIILAEALGIEQFRQCVKIYATDVDDEALIQARQALYLTRELTGLTRSQIEEFFEPADDRFTFRKDLRRSIIFGRHDLIQDAPISKIDLLVCRNVIMYFNAETQARILARFHFALREGGFLLLGKAEMLLTHSTMFAPINLKCRVFTKVSKSSPRDRLVLMAQPGTNKVVTPVSDQARLREAAFDAVPIARIVVDLDGVLTLVNERARSLFALSNRDIGRLLQDLEISYRPAELRSRIEQVYRDRRSVSLRDVEWQPPQGELVYFDVQISPLIDSGSTILGVSINFVDVTPYKQLQTELEHSNQELEMGYEELQSTHEELETTNEELQSSNEELETTNEELQSTNEELETMNEELQSTNEELETMNDELQNRTDDLNQSNAFLESILTSLKGGVVVVGLNLQVQIWNYRAEDLWGLRAEEALGQNFLNLDIGLPVELLRQPIRACLAGEPTDTSEVIVLAINRRGRSIRCSVACTALIGALGTVQGAILIMEERPNGDDSNELLSSD